MIIDISILKQHIYSVKKKSHTQDLYIRLSLNLCHALYSRDDTLSEAVQVSETKSE